MGFCCLVNGEIYGVGGYAAHCEHGRPGVEVGESTHFVDIFYYLEHARVAAGLAMGFDIVQG